MGHRDAFFFFIKKSFALKKQNGIFNSTTLFRQKCFFDDERNERIDGRFVPMTDSVVDNLIETDENAHTKKERLVHEILVSVFQRYPQ